jgi:hypothetical protein
MLIVIGQILAHPLASPQLRSALYRVASGLPGVTVREDVEDPVGRRGTALSFTERIGPTTNRHEVIFDPATTETLATRLVSWSPGHPRGARPAGRSGRRALQTPVRHGTSEAPRREGQRPTMKLSEPPHRGERLVMRRFTQYVVYLDRGLVGSPGDRP